MDRWVTFDCYGTLIDWRSGMLSALGSVVGDRAEALLAAYHSFEVQVEASMPHLAYREVLVETLRRAAALQCVEVSAVQQRLLADGWGSLAAFPEAPGVLAGLRRDGWRLAVLTNCDDDLFASTAAGLEIELDELVTAEQVRSYKPRLAHFEEFSRRTGADPGSWVHVGASWVFDVVPASRLGVSRIWVDREATGHDPTLATAVIGDLSGLPGLLADGVPVSA